MRSTLRINNSLLLLGYHISIMEDWQFKLMVVGGVTSFYFSYKIISKLWEWINAFIFVSYPDFTEYGKWAGKYLMYCYSGGASNSALFLYKGWRITLKILLMMKKWLLRVECLEEYIRICFLAKKSSVTPTPPEFNVDIKKRHARPIGFLASKR